MVNESPIQGWFQQGLSYHQAGELAKAEALYRKILAEAPKHSDTLHLLGVLQQQNKNSALAVELIKQAIAINPNIAAYHSNLGIALRNLNCHEHALASYERALTLKFDFPDAHYNKGVVLEMLERYEQALQSYCYASQYKPDYIDALWNECLCRLKLGDLSTGFAQYERRWQNPKLDLHFFPNLTQPRWNGQDSLTNKTIFLVAEQGLGDTLQFCRYAEQLAQLGANVLLGVQPPLKSLLSQLTTVSGVYVKGDVLPEFDYQCPLMSLPWLLKTELATIPATQQYLSASEESSAYWRQRLPPSTRPRVGLVWSGGQLHKNDHNRSIPLTEFAPLLALSERIEFISVQKEIRPNDTETLARF
ncbi:tetratricopeptide repeat protein [Methylocucumis oryzae]|uniref:tetratricopeptide repeat protein n=1 Tax=Methylocucumis oryzae TaxID=1632867 RepID=UPI0006964970|nr:tetratricopeptide repeat protein [Methylocucumis oryzae]